ncbi:FecR domain-containing protein [Bacillus sp. Marseille-P3661]|uniref:FecR domain-containing protein n=1 Tax=Bacillus sp. Marseille-P3661 TaxID=1936234 RepID=UPI000C859906|nr:FecR domain-containing protein [Bacillus sp. Marseille-P3661]
MKRIRIMLSFLLVLSLILPTLSTAAAKSTRIAITKDVKGKVYMKKGGGKKEFGVKDGFSLSQGDTVRTGVKSSTNIVYDDGSKSTIGPTSKVVISKLKNDESSKKTKIKMLSGKIWNSIQSLTNANDEYEIETPTSVMGVRGTLFLVTTSPLDNSTKVVVLDGEVGASRSSEQNDYDNSNPEQVISINETMDITSAQEPMAEVQTLNAAEFVQEVEVEILVEVIQDVLTVAEESHNQANQLKNTQELETLKNSVKLVKQAAALAQIQENLVNAVKTSSKNAEVESALKAKNQPTLSNIETKTKQLKEEVLKSEQEIVESAKNAGMTEEELDELSEQTKMAETFPTSSGNTGNNDGSDSDDETTSNPEPGEDDDSNSSSDQGQDDHSSSNTPPLFVSEPQAHAGVGNGDITLTANLNKAGTVKYVVVEHGATAPSGSQVWSELAGDVSSYVVYGHGSFTLSGSASTSSTINNLPTGKSYDIYMVAGLSGTDIFQNDVQIIENVNVGDLSSHSDETLLEQGFALGTTSIEYRPANGNTLAIKVSSDSVIPTGIGESAPADLLSYHRGDDIAVNVGQYIQLYELDSNNNVVKFMEFKVDSEHIRSNTKTKLEIGSQDPRTITMMFNTALEESTFTTTDVIELFAITNQDSSNDVNEENIESIYWDRTNLNVPKLVITLNKEIVLSRSYIMELEFKDLTIKYAGLDEYFGGHTTVDAINDESRVYITLKHIKSIAGNEMDPVLAEYVSWWLYELIDYGNIENYIEDNAELYQSKIAETAALDLEMLLEIINQVNAEGDSEHAPVDLETPTLEHAIKDELISEWLISTGLTVGYHFSGNNITYSVQLNESETGLIDARIRNESLILEPTDKWGTSISNTVEVEVIATNEHGSVSDTYIIDVYPDVVNYRISSTSEGVKLEWTDSKIAEVTGYKIFRAQTDQFEHVNQAADLLATVGKGQQYYIDQQGLNSDIYYYFIRPVVNNEIFLEGKVINLKSYLKQSLNSNFGIFRSFINSDELDSFSLKGIKESIINTENMVQEALDSGLSQQEIEGLDNYHYYVSAKEKFNNVTFDVHPSFTTMDTITLNFSEPIVLENGETLELSKLKQLMGIFKNDRFFVEFEVISINSDKTEVVLQTATPLDFNQDYSVFIDDDLIISSTGRRLVESRYPILAIEID